MKRYFGVENPEIPKDVALTILRELTPAKMLRSRHVSKSWQSLIEDKTLYFKFGVKGYDELQFRVSHIKSMFGRYLINEVMNNKREIVSQGGLSWDEIYKIDETFLEIEKSIQDGFAVSIWGAWVGECYQKITASICRLLTSESERTEFYTYCSKHAGTYANFFYNALKESAEFGNVRAQLPTEEESEDEFFAMN